MGRDQGRLSKGGSRGTCPSSRFHNHSIRLQSFPIQICNGDVFSPKNFGNLLHPRGLGQDDNSGARTCTARRVPVLLPRNSLKNLP